MLIEEETQMFSRVTFIGHFKYYLQIRFADVNVYTHHIEQFIQFDSYKMQDLFKTYTHSLLSRRNSMKLLIFIYGKEFVNLIYLNRSSDLADTEGEGLGRTRLSRIIQSDGNVFQKRNRKSGATENTCLVI